MNGLPYYKAYPRDFVEGTIGMPFELKGAYRLVLDLIYMQGGALPDDSKYIAGLLGCSVRAWNKYKTQLVEGDKIQAENGVISNFRATFELESLRTLQVKQRENRACANKNSKLPKPRSNQKPTIQNQNQKEKEEGLPSSKSKGRGTRIPNDFALTPKLADYARAKGLNERQIKNEFEKFTNYFTAASGQSSVKRDWNRAWYNWSITASERAGGSGRGGQDGNVSLASTASRLLGGMADGGPVSEGGQVISGGGGGEDIW